MAITITPEWLGIIKSCLGFPNVSNLLLEDDDIGAYAIFPALQKYFKKFPIKTEETQNINGEVFINFPDVYTFGIIDARVVDVGLIGGTGGSYWDVLAFQLTGGSAALKKSSGAYGIKGYNPSGLIYQREMQRQSFKSYQNQYMTIKYRVDYPNRRLIAYSSTSGILNITWAKYSNDFDDVAFERKDDVVKLSQAYLMQHLANSAAILVNASLEVSINTDYLLSRAQELFTEVKETWDSIPDVTLVHSA